MPDGLTDRLWKIELLSSLQIIRVELSSRNYDGDNNDNEDDDNIENAEDDDGDDCDEAGNSWACLLFVSV